jgi:hypothetical protein
MLKWIIGRLEAVSDRLGIRHAAALAQVLNMGKEIAVWDETKAAMLLPETEDEWEASTKALITSDALLNS